MLDILKQFNWVDLLIITLLIRICYVALKSSLFTELTKLFGTILATYLSLHYYPSLTDIFLNKMDLSSIPVSVLDFTSFIILLVVGYLAVLILREALTRMMKIESAPKLDKWGSLIFGVGRGLILASLIFFILSISTVKYLKRSLAVSYSGPYLFEIAPKIYKGIWATLGSKFMTKENFNDIVIEANPFRTAQ